jgi:hypothetical protein
MEFGTRPAFGLAKGQTRWPRGSAKVDVAPRSSRSPKDLARIPSGPKGFPLAGAVRRAIDPLDQLLVRLTVRRLAHHIGTAPPSWRIASQSGETELFPSSPERL